MDNYPGARRAFSQRLAKAGEIGRVAGKIVAEEAMTWDVFRWVVIALLVLNCILLVYGSTGPQVIATQQDHPDNYASDELNALRAQVNEVAAELTAVRFGLRLPTTQKEPELTTGSIATASIPLPTRSPQRH